MKIWQWIVFFALFCTLSPDGLAQAQLIRPTNDSGSFTLPLSPEVVRQQNIRFSPELFKFRDTLQAILFDSTVIRVVKDRNRTPGNMKEIIATIQGASQGSYVLIVQKDSIYAATLLYNGMLYQIRYIGRGVYNLRLFDQTKFPQEDTIALRPVSSPPVILKCPDTDAPDSIDVLVAYTPAAKNYIASKDATSPLATPTTSTIVEIIKAISNANLAYGNSFVQPRLRLVHTVEVAYTESQDQTLQTDLTSLQNPSATGSSTSLQLIHSLREQYHADIVVLLIQPPLCPTNTQNCYCGLSNVMNTLADVAISFGNNAFCVVKASCLLKNTLAHEISHIMGCRHNCSEDGTTTPFAYGHGYSVCIGSPHVHTIMTQNFSCAPHQREPYFSNPYITYTNPLLPFNMIPLGSVPSSGCGSDNHRVLNNTALIAANFRNSCKIKMASNVWIKDTWNDIGTEPYTLASNEVAWNSPDIWIRNSKGTSDVTQHVYQNPNPNSNSTNWIYVKLRNGKNAIAKGTVKIYTVKAGLFLPPQTSWTLVATTPLISIDSLQSKIVDCSLKLSANMTDAYSVIAQWVSTPVSADPLFAPPTTPPNLIPYVLNNNNIAWKNFHVVNLSGASSTAKKTKTLSFSFKRTNGSMISVGCNTSPPQLSFTGISTGTTNTPIGKITVKFTPSITSSMITATGCSLTSSTPLTYKITSPSGANFTYTGIDTTAVGNMSVTFEASGNQPKCKHSVSIQQKIGNQTIGGADCQIDTDYSDSQYP